MNVLWETGPANVQIVQAHIKGRELAYTTVRTMLNILHRKGKVKRQLKNRAYLFSIVPFSAQKAATQAVSQMLDGFFGGSADSLVLNLVETQYLTPEKLAEIQSWWRASGRNALETVKSLFGYFLTQWSLAGSTGGRGGGEGSAGSCATALRATSTPSGRVLWASRFCCRLPVSGPAYYRRPRNSMAP
jgi:predicted transcriptional regulator